MDADLIITPQREAPILLYQGEDRTFTFEVKWEPELAPADLAQVAALDVSLNGYPVPSTVIKRRLYGLRVEPEQVRASRGPGEDDLSVGNAVLAVPGHGLVSGDALQFSETAPQSFLAQPCFAQVLTPHVVALVDVHGQPIPMPTVVGGFTVGTNDVSLGAQAGLFTLRLRSHVTQALSAGPGREMQVKLGWQEQTRIVGCNNIFDIDPQLGQPWA